MSKKVYKLIVSLIICSITLSFLLFGFGCNETVAPAKEETVAEETVAKEKKLALLIEQSGIKRNVDADIPGFTKRAKELGYEAIIQDAEYDPLKQIDQMESVILQGVQGIALIPVDYQAGTKMMAMAEEAGIPVVAYNNALPKLAFDGLVGRNSLDFAEKQALKMVSLYPKGNYFLAGGPEENSWVITMSTGYHNALDGIPEIKIVAEYGAVDWSADDLMAKTENALTAVNDDVDAIVCMADFLANGVLQALRARDLNGKVGLCGQDFDLSGAQQILSGEMNFTAFTEFYQMAIDAVDLLTAIIEEKPLPEHSLYDNDSGVDIPWIETEVTFIDKDNIAEFVKSHTWWLPIEEVYKNVPKEEWPSE